MTRTAASGGIARYGAIELKDTMQLYWMMGLGIATAIHMAVIGSCMLSAAGREQHESGPFTPIPTYNWLPPPLNPMAGIQLAVAEHGVRHRSGTPVPVPAAIADSMVTLTPNVLLNPEPGPAPEGTPGDGKDTTAIDIPDASPIPFQIVEGMPQVVRRVVPDYPDVAIRAGLEGTVVVKVLVEKDGKPRDASVVKSDVEMLNEAAIAAAGEFVFTPGYSKSGPVAVWVAIPFRFRLADRK